MLKTAIRFTTFLLINTAVASSSVLAEGMIEVKTDATATGHPQAKLPHADANFLRQAAQSGHADIAGSKLALRKGSLPQVKAFAQTMLDEHHWAGEELTSLATSKGVTVPNDPSEAQESNLKALSGLEGASFDQHYADSLGVKAHQDAVKLFQQARDEAQDAEVKAFATKTLPILQHHLAMSRDLYATVHLAHKRIPQ